MSKNPWKVKSIQDFSCLKCPECNFNTKEEKVLQDHAVEKHPLCFLFCIKPIQSFMLFKCPECDFDTKEEMVFKNHAVKNHPLSFVFFGKIKTLLFVKGTSKELNKSIAQEISANDETVGLDPSEKYGDDNEIEIKKLDVDVEYPVAKDFTPTKNDLSLQEKKLNKKDNKKSCPFKCTICDFSCPENHNLSKHILEVHEGKKLFRCYICDKSFSQKCNLARHISSVHEKKHCYICK